MSRHYMLYWKFKTVEYLYYGSALDHIASDQLKKVEPGDTVWIVTVRSGDLLLTGRVIVGDVVDRGEQEPEIQSGELWEDMRWHVMAERGTAEPMQLINLTELSVTLSLRFHSVADRLRINRKGQLNAMSLIHMRLLTDESAALLHYVWYNGQALENVDIDEDQFVYSEGKPVVQTRVIRQRSSGLVNEAKSRYESAHGDLHCEICGMSFAEVYGEIGEGYMEAHHPEPLSEMDGEQFSDVDGIVLVCANCHRMIHRKSPPYSIEDLRKAVDLQRKRRS